jgi:hypothetical protein
MGNLNFETKKQIHWFKTDVNFENSFKFWFALQWQNKYLQIFVVSFILTLIGLFKLDWVYETVYENYKDEGNLGAIFAILGLSIPLVVSLVIAYKGFWQYFNDLKNGRNR